MRNQAILYQVVLWISVSSLLGCTTSSKNMFASDVPTTRQNMSMVVFSKSTQNSNVPLWSDDNLSGFTRDQARELDNMFPLYPNPTVYMYIDPHITHDGLPVLGYTTKFRLFRQDHYAMPSEIMGFDK